MIDLGFKDKVAIVTGAGGEGFGTRFSLLFAQEGGKVVCNDIEKSRADDVAKKIKDAGGEAIATYADLTKVEDCRDMVKQTLDAFKQVDVLLCVPAFTTGKKFLDETIEEQHQCMDVTFWGAVNPTREVLPHMIERKKGKIVIIGSDAGRVGEANMVIYGCTKAGVINFVKGISKEYGRKGIQANVVCSGANLTPSARFYLTDEIVSKISRMYPMGRVGEPDDMTGALVFMASDLNTFVTGQTLSVSGGYSTM